jgi:hypothetical protein
MPTGIIIGAYKATVLENRAISYFSRFGPSMSKNLGKPSPVAGQWN